MNWMHLEGSMIEPFVLAEKYWSGQQSSKPMLEALLENPTILEKII